MATPRAESAAAVVEGDADLFVSHTCRFPARSDHVWREIEPGSVSGIIQHTLCHQIPFVLSMSVCLVDALLLLSPAGPVMTKHCS